jgi:hypothetical protein
VQHWIATYGYLVEVPAGPRLKRLLTRLGEAA